MSVVLEENAHIGHGAIVHGGHIGKDVLIGMNAVIMDNVNIGEGSIVGALTLVPEGMHIPSRKLVVGTPAKIIKDVSDEMLGWKTEGTKIYQQLPKDMHRSFKACEPLRSVPKFRKRQAVFYHTLKQSKEN